jgi:anaerobic selenocysteine-containing dehydrogenase
MDHGGCDLLVRAEGNRIVEVKGDPEGYLNQGYLCPKAFASADRLTHPDRLRYPLKRVGGRGERKWERVSWSDAVRLISDRLLGLKEEYGAKSVVFGQGMPKGLELFGLVRLANLFGSPNVLATQDVCHAPREVTGIHTCGFYPVADLHHPSKLIVLWGSNVTSTNEEGQICSLLLRQLDRGTELIVVDPRKTELAEKARLWIQLRPGSDHALALAFLNVIITEGIYDKAFVEKWTCGFPELAAHIQSYTPERMSEPTWVDPEIIRKGARLYAASRPSAIQWGNPIEHTIHAWDSARALICLMAVCGNLDEPGGNVQANEPDLLELGRFVRSDLLPSKRKEMIHAYHGTIPKMMTVPAAYFRRAVLEGVPYPVKGAYLQGTNSLLAYAESRLTLEALMKLDFLAVSEIIMTPTAALADVVLPAATTFEFDDIGHYGLGHGCALARPKVVDPPEECWPDLRIINELGKTLTQRQLWFAAHEEILEEVLKPSGLTYLQFAEKGCLVGPDRFKKYLSSGFKTPTGKVELLLSQSEKFGLSPLPQFNGLPEDPDPDFPLVLTSCKSRYYLHSSYRWVERLRKHRPHPKTEIHPDTAARYRIHHGDQIIVETRKGAITQVAHVTDRVHPGVINSAYGWWFPEADRAFLYDWDRSNYNMLTSAERLGKAFGTPNLKGIGCRVRKAT